MDSGILKSCHCKTPWRHHSCIGREWYRNKTETGYTGVSAEFAYRTRRGNSKPKCKQSDAQVSIIEEKLLATWSPEQIANTETLGIVSFKTIYNWLYAGKLHGVDTQHLRHKGKRRKAEKRGKFATGTPISERPIEVKCRQIFGRWELDTMVSSRGESKGCFATFVERKSRLHTALEIGDRSAASMQAAISRLYHTLPNGAFKTGTTDRGKGFGCYGSVQEELNLTLYFADAYSSCQRGSNETPMAY